MELERAACLVWREDLEEEERMEPIISPWFIYGLSVVGALRGIGLAISVISGIILTITWVGWLWSISELDDYREKENNQKITYWQKYVDVYKNLRNKTTPLFIIAVFLAMCVPSRNTLIGMVVTNHITYDRLNSMVDAGKSVKDEVKNDIIELIEALKGDDKEK